VVSVRVKRSDWAVSFVFFLAAVYAISLTFAAGWAWWVSISIAGSPREHLLPGMLLAIISAPMSFIDLPFIESANLFMQLAWLTICGAVQAFLFFQFCIWLGGPAQKK